MNSQSCTYTYMTTDNYKRWCDILGHDSSHFHRKIWEHVFISSVMEEYNILQAGKRIVGFGVGLEPMPAAFASFGCKVLATDLDHDQAVIAGWANSGQYTKEAYNPGICVPEIFEKNVSYKNVDMNNIPSDLVDFDACYSSCSLDHLGSIDHGLAFIENSLNCLRPGGVAVHTTELNMSTNNGTIYTGSTVIFRKVDFEALAYRLMCKGHLVAPIVVDYGDQPYDTYIDVPPYKNSPHLKLELMGYNSTSFGFVVQKSLV